MYSLFLIVGFPVVLVLSWWGALDAGAILEYCRKSVTGHYNGNNEYYHPGALLLRAMPARSLLLGLQKRDANRDAF